MPQHLRHRLTACSIDLRRSLLFRISPLLGAAYLGVMYIDEARWIGIWPQSSAILTGALMYLAPLTTALSAFEFARRRPFDEQAEDSCTIFSTLIAGQMGILITLAIGAAGVGILTVAGGAPSGFLWPSYVIVAWATLAEASFLGALLGRIGGPIWFAPIVSCLLYLLRLVMTQGTAVGDPASRLTRVFLSGPSWVELSPLTVATAVGEALLIGILALYAPPALRRLQDRTRRYPQSRSQRVANAARSAGVLAILASIAVAPPMTHIRPSPATPLCTSTTMEICIWPDDAVYLPWLTTIATRAETESQELGLSLPERISASYVDHGKLGFVIDSRNLWFVSSTVAGHIMDSVIDVDCVPPGYERGLSQLLDRRQ